MSLLLYLTFLFSVRYILINRNRDYLGCDIVRGKFHQTKFQLHRCFDYLCILLTELLFYLSILSDHDIKKSDQGKTSIKIHILLLHSTFYTSYTTMMEN
jgi:hypothetical protein